MLYYLMSVEIGAEFQGGKSEIINNQFPGPFSISGKSKNWGMNTV